MKKYILIFLIMLSFVSCAETIFIDTSYDDTKPKAPKMLSSKEEQKEETTSNKKGIFSKFKKEKYKPQKKFNPQTGTTETVPEGYYGKLPDIKRDFQYKNQSASTSSEIDAKVPDDEELNPDNLKSAPFGDTLFLDNLVKKDKTSDYINDIQRTKFALQNLKKCIEEKGSIQRFNGCVNMVDLYTQNLQKKYDNKSDALRESYADILNTNYKAKVLGNLLYDANYYSRYVPTAQGQYSKENIEAQKQSLLNNINKTLFAISNEQ